MIAGAFAVGGGASLVGALGFDLEAAAEEAFAWAMAGGAIVLGLLAGAELVSRHPNRNVAAAVHHMTRGRYAREWWAGGQVVGVLVPVVVGLLVATGVIEPWAGAVGGVAAAAGIWFADDAFVRAGQSVPLS
jgi:hypothetical protein